MATKVYIAIASTSKTGDLVEGGDGSVYSATFSSINSAFSDPTYGERNLSVLDEIAIYQLFQNNIGETIRDSGFTTTPINYLIVESQLSLRHLGDVNNSLVIQNDVNYNTVLAFQKNAFLKQLTVKNTKVAGAHCCHMQIDAVADGVIALQPATSGNNRGFAGDAGGRFVNCIAMVENGYGFYSRNYNQIKVYNSIAYECQNGFYVEQHESGFAEVKNCVAIDCVNYGFSLYAGMPADNQKNNASTGTDAPGADSIQNIVAADCFENVGALDFHLKAGSQLKNTGFDLSGVNSTDIDQQPWEIPYSIGIDQSGEFTVPISISGVPLNTEFRIYDDDEVELAGVENTTADPAVLDMPYPGNPVNSRFVFHNIQYIYLALNDIVVGANGKEFPVSMQKDLTYKNP